MGGVERIRRRGVRAGTPGGCGGVVEEADVERARVRGYGFGGVVRRRVEERNQRPNLAVIRVLDRARVVEIDERARDVDG